VTAPDLEDIDIPSRGLNPQGANLDGAAENHIAGFL
jgi:hypothetical protein